MSNSTPGRSFFRYRVKVCGLTALEDARAAAAHGADALGFVFHPSSPRHLEVSRARAILPHVPPWVIPVAVVVDPTDALVEALVAAGFSWIQFSGDEPPERVQAVRRRFSLRVIKGFRVRGSETFAAAEAYRGLADLWLFDAYDPGRPGGTGRTWAWDLLREWRGGPFLVAGGLDADKVRAILTRHRHPDLFGFDLSSGLESRPGRKDPAKIAEFFRRYTRTLAELHEPMG